MSDWKFKPLAEDDTRENPTQAQFFTTEEVGNIANGLVREAIQNSLDEQDDLSKAVTVKLTLSNNKPLNYEEYTKYLKDLIPHLQSKDSGIRDLPDFKKDKLDYLVFEDFNTNGLRGDPAESKDRDINDNTKPHNFYYFWRNIGITGKPQDKLGRWGVGKTVFPASSRINTFWGLTIQSDTKAELLLGQCIIKKHNIEEDPQDWGYKPYGYQGTFKNDSFFPQPITEQSTILEFKSLFKLKRTTEPGLSIVIPFRKSSITLNSLKVAILKQYFYPILKGDLIVHLIEDDLEIILNDENLLTIAKKIKSEEVNVEDSDVFNTEDFISLIDFADWTIKLSDRDYLKLEEPPSDKVPRWQKQLWENIDKDSTILRFENNERIAFKIPVKYHNILTKDIPPKICWFNVFIEKDEKLKRPEDHFIRKYITIVDVKSLSSPGIRCIVLIEDKDISNLLGDAENPAHTQWQKDSEHFVNKYQHGKDCLQFITKSPQKVFEFLQRPATGIDAELLKNIFYIEHELDDNAPIRPDDDYKKDEITNKKEPPELEKNTLQRIFSKKTSDGIRVYSKNLPKENLPKIIVKLAYMTTRGKPLKKYQLYDFEINKAPITISSLGCNILSSERNEIELEVNETEFEMAVTGFDSNRDLFVKIDTQYPENNDTEI
jgi:hypothetical protein